MVYILYIYCVSTAELPANGMPVKCNQFLRGSIRLFEEENRL